MDEGPKRIKFNAVSAQDKPSPGVISFFMSDVEGSYFANSPVSNVAQECANRMLRAFIHQHVSMFSISLNLWSAACLVKDYTALKCVCVCVVSSVM